MQSEYDLIEELENLTVREIKRKCCELKISNYVLIYHTIKIYCNIQQLKWRV